MTIFSLCRGEKAQEEWIREKRKNVSKMGAFFHLTPNDIKYDIKWKMCHPTVLHGTVPLLKILRIYRYPVRNFTYVKCTRNK